MSRILLLMACLLVLDPAQAMASKHFAYGPIQFDADADGVVVVYHGHEWRPDLSKLAIRAEINDWQPLAWDESNEILYLAASTSQSQNPKGVILGYDLRSDQVNRVADYNEKYDEDGAVSPAGRYLIFVGHSVCGKCCTSSHLVAIDTQVRKTISFALPAIADNETVQVTGVRWTGSSMVEYNAEIHSDSDCRKDVAHPTRRTTGSLDVSLFLNQASTPSH